MHKFLFLEERDQTSEKWCSLCIAFRQGWVLVADAFFHTTTEGHKG